LLAQWDATLGGWLGLLVGHEHRLALRVAGTGGAPIVLDADDVLWPGAWTFVAVTVDREVGEAHLYARRQDESELHHVATSGLSIAPPEAGVPWRAGAYAAGGEPCGFFNGKIAGLGMVGRALTAAEVAEASKAGLAGFGPLLGLWDFAREAATERLVDVSGRERHGRALNNPARGVTDHTFAGIPTGEPGSRWSTSPQHYNALEFHDDDLDDARWQESFTWRVPDGLPSGLYAAHLTGAGAEAFLPLVVRAPAGQRAGLAMVVPTFTWQAYLAQRPAYRPHDDGSPNYTTTRRAPLHNPWWGSVSPKSYYDGVRGAHLIMADLYLINWLAGEGIAFDALADNDLHAEGSPEGTPALAGYRTVVLSAHPEYYSGVMYEALQAHLAGGGRLMYLGGDGLTGVTSVAPGRPHLLEIRRSGAFWEEVAPPWVARPGEEEHVFSAELGGLSRERGRAPDRILGIGFAAQGGWPGGSYRLKIDPADPRFAFIFAGVTEDPIGAYGLNTGGAAGHELDCFDPALGAPPGTVVLATADLRGHPRFDPLRTYVAPGEDPQSLWHADMVYYELPSGGAVFSVGSIAWTGALSHNGGDNGVARITRNVLARFLE
jgi:N,N-dimethylformamidase